MTIFKKSVISFTRFNKLIRRFQSFNQQEITMGLFFADVFKGIGLAWKAWAQRRAQAQAATYSADHHPHISEPHMGRYFGSLVSRDVG